MKRDSLIPTAGHADDRDPGAVLLLVLAVAIVLSLIVLGLANFVAADLRYSRVVKSRAMTLSSAESGIDYALGRMRLNQTLCSSDLTDADLGGGPRGLSGAAAPTTLPQALTLPGPLNGAVTTLTCERVSDDFPAVAGWSVIATLTTPDPIKVQVQRDRRITGPVFVTDPSKIVVPPPWKLRMSDGDIWYQNVGGCATLLPPAVLAGTVAFDEPFTRGPICTTATWNQIVSAPPLPDEDPTRTRLLDLPLNDGSVFTDVTTTGTCRVFRPGHYTAPPQIDPSMRVYFESGDYWFDNTGEWLVDEGADVSVGHPGSTTPSPPLDAVCDPARVLDPQIGGSGATFYFSGNGRIRVDDGASIEMFERRQGNFHVSIQELSVADGPSYPPSTLGTGIDAILRTRFTTGLKVGVIVHGLVWAPTNRVVFDNSHADTTHQLLGGIVARRLWIGDLVPTPTPSGQILRIEPASAATDAEIRLISTSTVDGTTTTVEALVAYRPGATNLAERVRVTSLRVVD